MWGKHVGDISRSGRGFTVRPREGDSGEEEGTVGTDRGGGGRRPLNSELFSTTQRSGAETKRWSTDSLVSGSVSERVPTREGVGKRAWTGRGTVNGVVRRTRGEGRTPRWVRNPGTGRGQVSVHGCTVHERRVREVQGREWT